MAMSTARPAGGVTLRACVLGVLGLLGALGCRRDERTAPSGTAAASATSSARGPAPRWVKGPSETFRCTRGHLDDARPGEPLHVIVSQRSSLELRVRAEGATDETVRYATRAPLPAGGELDAITGELRVPLDLAAGERLTITFVAAASGGGEADWPLELVAADDDTDLAWSLGVGQATPDCALVARRKDDAFRIVDVDRDGHRDALLQLAEPGFRRAEVRLWRDGRFVEAYRHTDVELEPDLAADGAPLLLARSACCGFRSLRLARLHGDAFIDAGDCQVADPPPEGGDVCRIEVARGPAGAVIGCDQICAKGGRTKLRLRDGKLDLAP